MMGVVKSFNTDYLKEVVPQMVSLLEEYYDDREFDGHLYEQNAWESCCESLLVKLELSGLINDDDFCEFSEKLRDQFDEQEPTYFSEKSQELIEAAKETKEYNKNPLGYHGLNQNDFV